MKNKDRFFQELFLIKNSHRCVHLYKKHSDMLRIMATVRNKSSRKEYFDCEHRMIAKHYID